MVFTLAYERNKVKYVWINEADSVFSKEGSLVNGPYVEPLFWEVLLSGPCFQSFMAYEQMIWKMSYAICNMLCAMCKMFCVQYDKYDDECYSHGKFF